jgi:hypothetical protein
VVFAGHVTAWRGWVIGIASSPSVRLSFSDGGPRTRGDGFYCDTAANLKEARASVAAGNAWRTKYLGGGTQGIGAKVDYDPKRYGIDISGPTYDDDYEPNGANVGRTIVDDFTSRGKFSRFADRRRK